MNKIVRYTLVQFMKGSYDAIDSYLELGWELYGNPFIRDNNGDFYQAMVKRES